MNNTSTVKLYNLDFDQVKTYLFATLFVAGNIVLPQLCHLIPNGGHIFLPIYFFTLVAAYKYGMKVGLMTAVLSPIINSLLFGMPPAAVVPSILIKSVFLAVSAASWSGSSRAHSWQDSTISASASLECSYSGSADICL